MNVSPTEAIRVLHVDDEPEFGELTADMLEREDDRFTVETVTNAHDGLEILDDDPPDCVVSDYNMPGMDGLEFLQTVREEYPDLPFILFTGKGSEAVASDAISAGVTDYLQKRSGTERYELLANRVRNAVQARRETQRAHRQEQLMRLTEFAGDTGGFEVNVETGRLSLTDGTRRLLGLPDATELSLEEAIELYHPDDQVEVRQAVTRATESGELTGGTWRLQTLDGDERLVDVTIIPATENGDGTILRGAIHDVTERSERRRKLERERERLDTVVSNIPGIVFALDPEGVFTLSRGKGLATLGLEADEVVGQSVFDIYAAHEQLLSDVERALDGERVTATHEVEGQVFESTFQPNFDDDGSVRAVIGVSIDVTEHKARERELELYRTMIETVPDAVYALDEDLHYIAVNSAMAELTGYSKSELVGSHLSLVVDEDPVETARENRRKLLESDADVLTHEYAHRTADGEEIPVENRFRLLRSDDEFRGTAGVIRDISDRKERERELERRNDRLDEFAGIVSHDLRNPLNVATARLELAREECENAHLADVSAALDRMDTLINDLLTLAREGKEVGETRPVELADVSRDCSRNVQTDTVTLVTETEQVIRADPSRLKELLENLLRNAVEHGGEDVTVTIGDIDDGFYVEDDGPGIPDTDREQIFGAGYSTTDDGTGFGLSIVEQVAQAHNWEIRFTHGDDGGARFEITRVDVVD